MKNSESPAAVEGSTLYYALLYVNDDASKKFIDTLHFSDAIAGALHDVSEPDVAEKKIHWWHEELARLANKQARHPATVNVQTFLNHSLDVRASLKVLSVSSNERFTSLKDDSEFEQAIQEEYDARIALLDSALDNASAKDATAAIARGLGQFARLNNLVKMLRRGYAVFSDERYAQFDLSPEQVLSYSNNATASDTAQPDENINALMKHALDETHYALKHATECIAAAKGSEKVSLPLQIMCQIRYAQVQLWKKRKPDLLRESIRLTPLRKFFIAYRCKRRFG